MTVQQGALSPSSPNLSTTCRQYKLQSISISGALADQVARFVLTLDRTPKQYSYVSYLVIEVNSTIQPVIPQVNGEFPSCTWSPIVHAAMKAVEVIPRVRRYKKSKRLKQNVDHTSRSRWTSCRRDALISAALLQIFHLTGVTLKSLDVDWESTASIALGLPGVRMALKMPMLTSLTVCILCNLV